MAPLRAVVLVSLLAPGATAQPRPITPRDFSGEWVMAVRSRTAMGLRLRQEGAHLRGEHCANSWGAARIDGCDAVDIAGEVTGDAATITFQCFGGAPGGRARLVWSRGMILWHVTPDSLCEDSWVPARATLRRGRAWWPTVR